MKLSPEVVRQHGVEELEHLRFRLGLWKEDYLRQAPANGGSDYFFLCREFVHEIEEYLYPYVQRLIVTEHITREEGAQFMDFCYQQVLDVVEHLGLESGPPF